MAKLLCPECGSDQVTVSQIDLFMANTGEFRCHSVKPHDLDSPASCWDCHWDGYRSWLKEASDEKK